MNGWHRSAIIFLISAFSSIAFFGLMAAAGLFMFGLTWLAFGD